MANFGIIALVEGVHGGITPHKTFSHGINLKPTEWITAIVQQGLKISITVSIIISNSLATPYSQSLHYTYEHIGSTDYFVKILFKTNNKYFWYDKMYVYSQKENHSNY